ncbi:esterase/lipase family protein [Kistimonas asteriae]|uniref:esterase/lipase family protein n=1 Tax=Kistimonas asteriae TaxID=517724 RepID=UPI001BA53192|nr:hypothetical protein [Kistimonas asteriae]
MPIPVTGKPRKHLYASDLRGLARLATEATTGVTRIVEGVHQSVWRTLGAPSGSMSDKTRGLTGGVYQSVYGITRLVGGSVDAALAKLDPYLDTPDDTQEGTFQRDAVLAALNGVMGDRLVAGHHPFASAMCLRYQGATLENQVMPQESGVTGKILLLVHGLCMNDQQWRVPTGIDGVDQGEALAVALGYTPVYLRYNSGLHTSINGRELSSRLEQLVAHWPKPVEELTIVGYSMGGLVTRSACYYGQQAAMRWPEHLKHMVFLGTPHHGAPLEKAGNWLDSILGITPYTAPFARLVRLRSAGITDLRHGHVRDEDWEGRDRFHCSHDPREEVSLPEGVACHSVAATTAARRSVLVDRLIGDGLVPLHSALGTSDREDQCLAFDDASQFIAYSTNHMALLHSAEVSQQLVRWLTPE